MLAGLAVDAVVSATLVKTVGDVVDGTALDEDELTSTWKHLLSHTFHSFIKYSSYSCVLTFKLVITLHYLLSILG